MYSSIVDIATMLCAGTDNGGKESCHGNFVGGHTDKNKSIQICTESFGNGCGGAIHTLPKFCYMTEILFYTFVTFFQITQVKEMQFFI